MVPLSLILYYSENIQPFSGLTILSFLPSLLIVESFEVVNSSQCTLPGMREKAF